MQTDSPATAVRARSLHEFEARDIDGQVVDLAQYAGRVLLVVNIASQ